MTYFNFVAENKGQLLAVDVIDGQLLAVDVIARMVLEENEITLLHKDEHTRDVILFENEEQARTAFGAIIGGLAMSNCVIDIRDWKSITTLDTRKKKPCKCNKEAKGK